MASQPNTDHVYGKTFDLDKEWADYLERQPGQWAGVRKGITPMADQINPAPAVQVAPVIPAPKAEPTGLLGTEPTKVATRGVQAVAFVSALLIFFGVDLSSSQEAVLPIITIGAIGAIEFLGNWLRANVTPVGRAEAKIDQAYIATPEAGAANKPTLPAN